MQPARNQSSHPLQPHALHDIAQQEFGMLAEPYRRELQAHCYRMVGSVLDAEELVQEAFLRAWRRRETYEGRAPFRAWLYKIATNLCLDVLRQRPRRMLPTAHQPASSIADPLQSMTTELAWLEPFPDTLLAPEDDDPETQYSRRESVSLAFTMCLQLLPPRQRAVLIVRDVLGWPASEAADLLGVTVPTIKSALHRARTTLRDHYRGVSIEDISPHSLDAPKRSLLERYVQAWEAADVDQLLALLKEDASFSMPPEPGWFRGRPDIRAFITATIFSGKPERRWRLQPTQANGQVAFGVYRWGDEEMIYQAYGIQVLSLHKQGIADIITFRNPALLPIFRLPAVYIGS